MVTIHFYPNGPQSPDTRQTFTAENLAAWVVANPPHGEHLYIWTNEISNETYVREITDGILTAQDIVFHISTMPSGPAVWIPLIISVVVGVAAALLLTPDIPIPETTNSNRSSNNALQSRSNQPRVGLRLPDIRGREPKCFPDLWMTYAKFYRNKEFDVSYLCASVGQLDIETDTVLDGDTPLANIPDTSVEFYNPYTSPNSGAPFLTIGDPIDEPLASVVQSNEVDGATLLPPNQASDTGPFRAFSSGRIESTNAESPAYDTIYEIGNICVVTDFYSFENTPDPLRYARYDCSGSFVVTDVGANFIELDVSAKSTEWSFFTGDIILQTAWQNPSDPTEWDIFENIAWTQVDWQSRVRPVLDILQGPFVVSGYEQVWLNMIAQGGIYKKRDKFIYFDITLRVVFTELPLPPVGPPVTTQYDFVMSSNRDEFVGKTFEFDVPYPECSITVYRVSETDLTFNGTVVDEIKWRDLYLVNLNTSPNFGNVTTLFTKTTATESALRAKERKLSFACTRYITRPDDTYLASSDFADVIYSLHTDPFIGRRDKTTIDYQGLYELQQYIVDYFGTDDAKRVGYTFDDDTYRYEDHLNLICNAVNVSPYQVGSLIKFWFEGPQSISVQQFGHRSKLPNKNGGEERRTRSLKPRENYDGVELTYKSEVTGDFETIYVPSDQSAVNPEVVDFNGCNVPRFALVKANRMRNKQIHERITHEFVALDKARLLAKGQRVDVIDNTRFTPNDGYVMETDGLTYYLSQPHEISGTNYSVVLTKRDGTLEGIPVVAGDEDNAIILQYAPSEQPYTGYLADATEYSLSTDDEKTKLAMLVKLIEPRDTDNIRVTCGNYDVRYYKDDLA